ncbi:MAG: hypothetical protein IPH20_14270 [Bacteroidales bacterium]|nr:hypothetical protein [Bacteroidales bacterium]
MEKRQNTLGFSENEQINKKSILFKALLQEGLIDKKATLPILETIDDKANLEDIYFGTGISNPHELTAGIPFDF